MPSPHLQSVDAEDPPGEAGSGGRNGNGGLTRYRIGELERRMGVLEGRVREIGDTCTRIETKLDDVAKKSYVLWIFGGTAAVLVLSLVGHAFIRGLVSG